MIRILHLATSLGGGAGIAAMRLHKGLQDIGVQSTFICRENLSTHVNSSALSKLALDTVSKSLSLIQIPGNMSKGSLVTPIQIDYLRSNLGKIRIEEFDAVHIHAPFNFIGDQSLKEIVFRSRGKVFITLHDERFFTGGCHYSAECKNYESICQKCPQVRKGFQRAVEKRQIKTKKLFAEDQLFEKIVFVAPSRWIAERALRSTILRNKRVEVIPNGIPKVFFESALNREVRRKTVVGFSASSIHNPYKGFEHLINAMREMNTRAGENYQLRLLGSGKLHKENFEIVQGIAKSDSEIIDFLHHIDVLAVPSTEDNLPSVALEALAAGVPVVGTSVGGIEEILEICNMPRVLPKDSLALAEALLQVLESDKDSKPERISKKAEMIFSIEKVAALFLEMYTEK